MGAIKHSYTCLNFNEISRRSTLDCQIGLFELELPYWKLEIREKGFEYIIYYNITLSQMAELFWPQPNDREKSGMDL